MREGGSLIAFVRDPDGYRIELIETLVSESRLAVIDCGSNSFRLVVFTYTDTWWKRTDEIHEAVRVGEGLEATGALGEEPMERALETLELYAHFCDADGDRADPPGRHVGDPRRRQPGGVPQARRASAPGSRSRCCSGPAEARYGYLAAINSTTLSDGVVLDLGGGSMQLTRVEDREAVDARSWPLGRRAHDRALPARRARPSASRSRRCASTSRSRSRRPRGSAMAAG